MALGLLPTHAQVCHRGKGETTQLDSGQIVATTTTEAPRRARLFTEGGRLMLHGDDVVLHVGEDIGKGKRPGPVCSA